MIHLGGKLVFGKIDFLQCTTISLTTVKTVSKLPHPSSGQKKLKNYYQNYDGQH